MHFQQLKYTLNIASSPIWPFQGYDKLMMLYGLAIMGQILDFKGQMFYTVRPVNEVTSIKQPSVLRGHYFLSCYRNFHMN